MNGDMCSIEISTLNGYKTKNERKVMNDKFDELAKSLAQSVTRRGALKKFGLGLTGMVLACLGLPTKVYAGHKCHCKKPDYGCKGDPDCVNFCQICCAGGCF